MSLASASDLPRKPSPSTAKVAAKISPAAWVWSFVALAAALWGTSIALFGVPGLYIPAVAAVPVIFAALIVISRG